VTKRDAYRDAGVDIEAADRLIEKIGPLAQSTHGPGVLGGLGGFGGLFSLQGKFRDPVLVSGTDGVGTKLLVAQKLDVHNTIGIDLVAMCVNDIVVSGAQPLFFLDYFATGKLQPHVAAQVIEGIVEGCRQAGCALIGGETAEMPGMYAPGHYDLAGFAVGAVERDEILERERVRPGQLLVGLPASGVHSNGFSLVRKLLIDAFALDTDPHGMLGHSLGEELLVPTHIYVNDVLKAKNHFDLSGAAHITGGGLPGNLPRIMPQGLEARLDRGSWPIPPIFEILRQRGDLSDHEMYRTFNMGLGMVLVLPAEQAREIVEGGVGLVVGEVVESRE
jgi:phosphoribosylformylglycinamidine cyclo-ligase